MRVFSSKKQSLLLKTKKLFATGKKPPNLFLIHYYLFHKNKRCPKETPQHYKYITHPLCMSIVLCAPCLISTHCTKQGRELCTNYHLAIPLQICYTIDTERKVQSNEQLTFSKLDQQNSLIRVHRDPGSGGRTQEISGIKRL